MDIKKITRIFEGSLDGDPLDEILYLAEKVSSSIDLTQIQEVHKDLISFFPVLVRISKKTPSPTTICDIAKWWY
jgi:hypothetical protein